MTDADSQRRALAGVLEQTCDEELDCDKFVQWLAAYVDGGLESEEVEALMKRHEQLCGECAEEYQLLKKALGRD